MTLDEIRSLFRRVSCPPYRFKISASYDMPGCATCEISATVPDRDTGAPIDVLRRFTLSQLMTLTPRHIHERLRHELYAFVCHEIDETFRVDTVRVFEPHPTPLLREPAGEATFTMVNTYANFAPLFWPTATATSLFTFTTLGVSAT